MVAEVLPDGSTILIDPVTNMTYSITESAALLWESCDGTRDAGTLAAVLADHYDAPFEVIRHDVDRILEHLSEIALFDAS